MLFVWFVLWCAHVLCFALLLLFAHACARVYMCSIVVYCCAHGGLWCVSVSVWLCCMIPPCCVCLCMVDLWCLHVVCMVLYGSALLCCTCVASVCMCSALCYIVACMGFACVSIVCVLCVYDCY